MHLSFYIRYNIVSITHWKVHIFSSFNVIHNKAIREQANVISKHLCWCENPSDLFEKKSQNSLQWVEVSSKIELFMIDITWNWYVELLFNHYILLNKLNISVNSEANARRIALVENCFGNAGQPLSVPGRVLVGEGVLTKACRKRPKPRQFFLFNDLLVYGNIIITKKK